MSSTLHQTRSRGRTSITLNPAGGRPTTRRYSAGRSASIILAAGLLASCGSVPATPSDAVAAAEIICPIMWTWVKDVGTTFNEASTSVSSINEPQARRNRWMEAFDEIETLEQQLLIDVAPYRNDAVLGPLIHEIERDVPLSIAELDDIRDLFLSSPEVDDGPHQDRTMQVIVRIEKVIDLPKPDLGELDVDGTLLPAFRKVPSCQHSIRDVDDGSAQTNG